VLKLESVINIRSTSHLVTTSSRLYLVYS